MTDTGVEEDIMWLSRQYRKGLSKPKWREAEPRLRNAVIAKLGESKVDDYFSKRMAASDVDDDVLRLYYDKLNPSEFARTLPVGDVKVAKTGVCARGCDFQEAMPPLPPPPEAVKKAPEKKTPPPRARKQSGVELGDAAGGIPASGESLPLEGDAVLLRECERLRGECGRLGEDLAKARDSIARQDEGVRSRIESLMTEKQDLEAHFSGRLDEAAAELDSVKESLQLCQAERDGLAADNAGLRREFELLGLEATRLETERQSLASELAESKKRFDEQANACEEKVSKLKADYDAVVPEKLLSLFGLAVEDLRDLATTHDNDVRIRIRALRFFQDLMEADCDSFVKRFQAFDAALLKLGGQPDFAVRRAEIEKNVTESLGCSGFTVTWSLEGEVFDPARYVSIGDPGTTVSRVERALIQREGNVVAKAYVYCR